MIFHGLHIKTESGRISPVKRTTTLRVARIPDTRVYIVYYRCGEVEPRHLILCERELER